MCCMRLAGNTGRKNDAKNCHLRTIAQLCRAKSSQLRHVSTIGKKLVKQQYLPHVSLQYGELRHTSGWDRFVTFGHPSKFQRVSRLGTAVLNRGRYLYSTGRPSRWALAHISSYVFSLVGFAYGVQKLWGLYGVCIFPKIFTPHIDETVRRIQKS